MKVKDYLAWMDSAFDDKDEEIFCNWWTKRYNKDLAKKYNVSWKKICWIFDHKYHWILQEEFESFLDNYFNNEDEDL